MLNIYEKPKEFLLWFHEHSDSSFKFPFVWSVDFWYLIGNQIRCSFKEVIAVV